MEYLIKKFSKYFSDFLRIPKITNINAAPQAQDKIISITVNFNSIVEIHIIYMFIGKNNIDVTIPGT
ncbi:hypothetical protein [Clostridium saccharobutylicum]|uniref:hypothetical protein n=1 Tax=Clostridium saccharobutylicum TaxID=169679 RepID=UPI00040B7CA0|nr:hypothetical protein [Clostridium saccharobutylicum]MBA8999105.1 hypothetical protein [Clostridium saccharobutylicum]MBA9010571.1 hypothetical protein [Clostridium saccharobutylicum]NOV57811.1 hypothetical protein [Clostridium saccharobutylicum]NOV75935.1 hypothetical protein [Clostridium saccharobutylicum]NOV80472.1 hypothetical protein [Clostridium saccharobutylicum]